jgi:hypothetical protein
MAILLNIFTPASDISKLEIPIVPASNNCSKKQKHTDPHVHEKGTRKSHICPGVGCLVEICERKPTEYSKNMRAVCGANLCSTESVRLFYQIMDAKMLAFGLWVFWPIFGFWKISIIFVRPEVAIDFFWRIVISVLCSEKISFWGGRIWVLGGVWKSQTPPFWPLFGTFELWAALGGGGWEGRAWNL